jgi:hypothetical protein
LNTERLEILARRIERIPIRNFDMHNWVDIFMFNNEGLRVSKGRPSCNTTACAMGWATTIKKFNKEGLVMAPCGFPLFKNPSNGEEYIGFRAAEEFFGLERRQSTYLFSRESYPHDYKNNPRIVANRIRGLLISGTVPTQT